jgi:CheY-like chemotaxis protein
MAAVTDTGSGMIAEVASRAFEPFFTTKEVGKGTGLGLSMVYGFAKQSGGSMQIRSEPGHGTVVKLFFLRVGSTPRKNDAPSADRVATPTGSETILVVEDNDLVRSYVEKELKELGYRVIATRNGPEALAILRQPGEIDLLFTDVVMPGGMFGPELAKQAMRLRPGLEVLFTSGYTEHPVQPLDGLDGETRILNKPYRRNDLALMLRMVLKAR